VLTVLHVDPKLVQVEIDDGIVYLDGIALHRAQKQGLEAALMHIAGVRRVINCLAVEHVARLAHSAPAAPAHYPSPLKGILAGKSI
jgi:hypothetical protein